MKSFPVGTTCMVLKLYNTIAPAANQSNAAAARHAQEVAGAEPGPLGGRRRRPALCLLNPSVIICISRLLLCRLFAASLIFRIASSKANWLGPKVSQKWS